MGEEIVQPEGAAVTVIDGEIRSVNPSYGVTPEMSEAANNSLGVIIPSVRGRKIAYAVYAGVSLVVTNAAVGFAALNVSFPAWLTVSIAVVGNLAAPFGAIAIANVRGK